MGGGHVAWKPAPEELGVGTILDINGSNGDNRTLLSYQAYEPTDSGQSSPNYLGVFVEPESIQVANMSMEQDRRYAYGSILSYDHLRFSNDYAQIEFSISLDEHLTFSYRRDKIEYMYWPASDTDVDSYLGFKTDN